MWEYLTLIAQWVPEEKNKSGHWLINEEYSTEQLAETLNLFGKAEWEIISIFPERTNTYQDGTTNISVYRVFLKGHLVERPDEEAYEKVPKEKYKIAR